LHWWLGVAATTSPPGKVCFQLRDTNHDGDAVYSSTVVQDGEWHHVAAVRDGAAGINYVYVDGVEEGALPMTYGADFSGIDIPMNVGWLDLNPYYHYDGIVDEVAIYGRALDATEIFTHYVAGTTGLGYCTGGEASPIITSNPVTHIYSDQIYAYDVQAVGNPAPGFALLDGPAGMTIDPATGLIEWTPSGIGDYPVEVEASNSQGTDTQAFTLSVTERPLCPDGMDTYWKLDDPTPGTYVDHYGGFDGQALVSPPAPSSPGIVGDCQDFNGTSNFITVADDPVFDWAGDVNFTIELWFNATNVASRNKVMIGRDQGGGSPHWWLGLNQSTGYANWNLLDANGNGIGVTGSTSLNDGQWHHMVAVRDESLNQNRLYVDGGLVATASHNYTAGFGASTSIGIGYMAYNSNPDYYYDGKLDEIALYSRALDLTEIQDHWNGGAGMSYCSDDAAAPVITSTPVTSGQIGEPYSYDVNASGIPAPTYSLITFPAGMTIDPVTGVINWTPAAAGDVDVEVVASNTQGSDNQIFTINVTEGDTCPAGLNAYWKLDEDPGPPFVDWAGDADATCGSCPAPTEGIIGGAQWFDGADEVNVSNSSGFDWGPDDSFTITYWMKTDQSTAGNRVLIGRDGDGLHMWIGCDNNGTVRFQLKENGGDYAFLGGIGPVLNDNQWHYIVAVRDNDADHNAIYVDNELIDETTFNYTYGFASSAQMNIGYLNLGGHYRYHGAMDDIAVYDKALSDQEMWQLFENGKASLDLCTPAVPAFISDPVLTGVQDELYSYDADAVGTPGPIYSLTTAPAGMTIDPVTGMIDWVPASGGTAAVVVAATNVAGTTEQSFSIVMEGTEIGDAPLITGITDVGEDEGGQVRLVWNRSPQDASDTDLVITGYGVYRRQDANKAATSGEKMAGWDYIDTVPARGDEVYQFVAPTLCDYTESDGICWSVFFVSAMTPEPLVFFDSPVDSGYSVDNLAPAVPGVFQVAYDHLGNSLTWDDSGAPDLLSYLVYRSQTAEFEPGEDNLVASVVATDWFDPVDGLDGNPFEVYYRIAAQDSAGNISDPAEPGAISGVGDPSLPTRFALHGNVPNPFNPMTVIKFDLPVATRISLKIFDLSGRLVAVLKNNEFEAAGRHEVVWRGRDHAGQQVAAGVYFYRMEGGSFNQTQRMVLVK
jgi:hypothetical protein